MGATAEIRTPAPSTTSADERATSTGVGKSIVAILAVIVFLILVELLLRVNGVG
jgi:hypothetical protein